MATGKNRFGRRSLADKLWSLLGKLGAHGRPALRSELLRATAELERQAHADLADDADDALDFLRYIRPISAASVVSSFFDGAPLGPIKEAHALLEDAEEELGSGGPPLSPVHDSLQVTWGILDLKLGRSQETFASVARSLLTRMSLLPECVEQLRALEAEPLGVFAVRKLEAPRVGASVRVTLQDLATDRELTVQFAEDYDVRATDLLLLRPTALPEDRALHRGVSHLCYTTPYVCDGQSPAAWRDYFERAAGDLGARLDEASYHRVMRGEGNPRRWLEFVFEGFVGARALNVVEVAGIPDLPHTLPHHDDYDEDLALAVPPGADPTTRSQLMIQRTLKMLSEVGHEGIPKLEAEIRMLHVDPHADWTPVIIATGLSEGASNTGPLLDVLERRFDFDADLQEWAAATRAGWVSLFEVLATNPGEGVRVRDAIEDGEYDVVERSGSRMLKPGMLLFGRLISYRGVHMFEITLNAIARSGAERATVDAVKAVLRGRPMRGPLVYEAANTWIAVGQKHQRKAMPTLVTTTGEPLVFCVIVLSFSPNDRKRVRQAIGRLQRCYAAPADDSGEEQFVVHTRSDVVEARLMLDDNTLRIESNAKKRADAVLSRLRSKLPKVLRVEHRQAVPMDQLLGG